ILPQQLLTDFLTALLAHLGHRRAVRVVLSDLDPPKLMHAWTALPLALQRKSSWAIGMEACPVDVIFTRSTGTAASEGAQPALIESVQGYVSLLHSAPDRAAAILK